MLQKSLAKLCSEPDQSKQLLTYHVKSRSNTVHVFTPTYCESEVKVLESRLWVLESAPEQCIAVINRSQCIWKYISESVGKCT